MPTLAANLLSDAGDGHAPADVLDTRTKRKKKSITVGKGGPGSGPQGGKSGKTPEQIAAIKSATADRNTGKALRSGNAVDHYQAMYSHYKAAAAQRNAGNGKRSAEHVTMGHIHRSAGESIATPHAYARVPIPHGGMRH